MEPKTEQTTGSEAKVSKMIGDAVAAAVAQAMTTTNEQVKALGDAVTTLAKSTAAVKVTHNADGIDSPRPAIVGKHAADGEGLGLVRILAAGMALKLNGQANIAPAQLAEELKRRGYEREGAAVTRAMSQSIFADGGALVPNEYVAELIPLLRNKAVFRELGAREIPMGASLEMPEQTGAATATWVGETSTITDSTPSVGTKKLAEKKLAGLVGFSNDLVRNASIAAEQFIRNDLVAVMALKEDSTALYSDGGAYSPRGLVSMVDSSHQVNATASSQVAPTLAELKAEIGKAIQKLAEANIPMTKLGWMFSPRTWRYLWQMTDGNGNPVYQEELDRGTLAGIPYRRTNQVVNTDTWSVDGSTDVSRIFLTDFDQFIIGESMAMQVEAFMNAAFSLSGTVVSGISTDRSCIRALLKEDFLLRYAKAGYVIKTRMGG